MSARHLLRGFAALVVLAMLAGCDSQPVPHSLELVIDPSRTWYHTGQTVELFADVRSLDGTAIPDVEIEWTVEPTAGATMGSPEMDPRTQRFTLGAEGVTIFHACVVPLDEMMDPTICDSLRVRVDDGMPSLEVSSPTPGQEITGEPIVEVRGSVADRSMVNVYINGRPAMVDEMGNFQGTVEALFGVNHLVVSASDGLTNPSVVELDVLYAPVFTPALGMDGTPGLTLDDGISLWLGQSFFDDGSSVDLEARPIETQDLADVIELVVGNLDVSSYIPDPIVDSPPSFTLRASGARIGEPGVEIDVTDDGVDLFVRIGLIQIDTSGALIVDGTSLPLTGTVTASAVAFAHITIRKENEMAALEVSVGDLSVGLESLQGSFISPETEAVFVLVGGVFRTALEDALVEGLQGTIESSVPSVLRDALTSIDTALAGQTIELDNDLLSPVTVEIDGRIAQLRTAHRRELSTALRVDIGTSTPSVHPESLGVPRLTDLPALPFVNEGRIQLGLRLALLNGLLHSLWASGLLEVDASTLLPESVAGLVSDAQIVGRIQPMLRPPRADETDDLVLSIGQLELELVVAGQPARFGLSLDAGMNISFMDDRIAIGLADEPALRVWTIESGESDLITEETIRALLLELWPDLRESLAGGLGFDLPAPDVGDLGGLAPGLSGFGLRLQTGGELRYRRGVLVLDAEMPGSLP